MRSRRNQKYDPLGEFEALVLMAVLRLGDEAYGMRIHRELETTAKRKCSFGALYTTLDRLEEKGYLSSSIGEPTAERGGRAKKYFEVRALGVAALRQTYEATKRMARGIEPLLGGAS
jgi:PadR family transcriptional regulator PadR